MNHSLKKIPIIITKCNEPELKGWRAELPDNYENYKTSKIENINFEDLSFHFVLPIQDNIERLFSSKKEAITCADYVNSTYLNKKSKIWYIK